MQDDERILAILRVETNKKDSIGTGDLMRKESKSALILLKAYSQSKNPSKFLSEVLKLSPSIPYLAIEFFMSLKKIYALTKCFWGREEKNKLYFTLDYYETYKGVCRIYYLLNSRNLDNETLEKLRKDILSDLLTINFAEEVGSYRDNEIKGLIKKTISLLDEKKLLLVEKELVGEFFLEDVKIIQEKIGSYKLNPSLSKSLIKIKDSNPNDENEYARDLGYIRTFLQEMIEDLANKISIKYNENIERQKNESKYTSCKRYLRKKEIIDEREEQLINALYSLLSKGGSHKLTYPREKYRLVFNMVIETSILLLSNSETFLNN